MLLEDTWKFTPDREKITLVESKGGTLKSHVVPGVLSKCDEVNGNNRRYRRPVWEANVKEGSRLQQRIAEHAAFGLLEHPADGNIDLRSPISHAITKIHLAEDGTLLGELTILDGEGFPDGKKLRGLIEFGYDPLVSSRGYGSVIKGNDGVDEVQEDFICEGWDVVMAPSFANARLSPSRDNVIVRQETIPSTRQNVVVENTNTTPSSPPQKIQKATVQIMDINQIRASIGSLRSVDILKANPRTVAESFTQATMLHRQVAEALAAAPNLSWDAHQLHEEISNVEKGWTESMQRTLQENIRLLSDRSKLVVIAENMTKTARLYRKQLTEVTQKRNATAQLYEAVSARGRGWQTIASRRGAKNSELEHQCQVASRAIDMLAEQVVTLEKGVPDKVQEDALNQLAIMYHGDTTKLARENFSLKYPEDAAKPEIKEKLEKATTVEDIVKIATDLGKIQPPPAAPAPAAAGTTPNKPVQEGKTAPAAPIQESAASASPNAPAAPVQEGVSVIVGEQFGHQLSFEQAVAVTRRLSTRINEAKQEPTPAAAK
jgi:hypothetical protein